MQKVRLEVTQYFIDTEFVDTGSFIDLISIGIVSSDGRELYMQSTEFNPDKASPWVQEHVLPSLEMCPHMPEDHSHPYAHAKGQCTFERPATGITGLSGLVMPDAYLIGAYEDCPWRTREQIKNELQAFITGDKIELYGWCAGYDFVALCQLFGTMMDMPATWPHYVKDLQQVLDDLCIRDDELPPQESGAHNALSDAKHTKQLWNYISAVVGK